MVQQPVELEVAVTRGREYLARAVFWSPALVSVGRDPAAVVHIDAPELPALERLFHLRGGQAHLEYSRGVVLELLEGERMRRGEELGAPAEDPVRVPLGSGAKGVFKFGEYRVLFKLQPRRECRVRLAGVAPGGEHACAECGVAVSGAIDRGGALSLCPSCGVLNRFVGQDDFDAEPETDADAPRPGPDTLDPDPLDPERTVSDGPGPAGARRDALQSMPTRAVPTVAAAPPKGADLPSYDALQSMPTRAVPAVEPPGSAPRGPVKAADLPTFDAIEAQEPPSAPALPAWSPMGAPGSPVDGSAPTPLMVPVPGGGPAGADLPTFDAISAVKDQGLSTAAAIRAMRGDTEAGEPAQIPEQIGPGEAVLGAEPPGPGSEVAPTGEEPPVRRGRDDLFSDGFAREASGRPTTVPETRPVKPRPDFDGPTVPAPRPPSAAPAEEDLPEDDFLLGGDAGDLGSAEGSGLLLYAVGFGSMIVGIALILARLL